MLPTIPSAPPPISELNPDVLLLIFSLNDEANHNSIRYLRHTSQVCSTWRKLVLSSPGLWSCALNFDAFGPSSRREWKEEVIRRTGTSGLQIQAYEETLISLRSWIYQILDEHWARTRDLDLEFSQWCAPSEKWLSIFRRPAPSLESFEVIFHHTTPVSLSSASSALFDNNAPCLRILSVLNGSLDLTKTSWASNLRCLEVKSSVPLVQLLRAFVIVPFPFLETLELADSDRHARNTAPQPLFLHPISLPHLKQVNIRPIAEIASSFSFLANAKPAPGCQLTLNASANLSEAFILDDLPRVFNQYHPDPDPTTEWDANSLVISFFSLSKFSFEYSFSLPASPIGFNFKLNCYADSGLPGHAISAFVSSIPTSSLEKIKKLELSICPGGLVASSAPLVPHVEIDAAVEQFVRAAHCVEELVTDTRSLEWLKVFQKKTGEVVFPCVKKTRDAWKGKVQMPSVVDRYYDCVQHG